MWLLVTNLNYRTKLWDQKMYDLQSLIYYVKSLILVTYFCSINCYSLVFFYIVLQKKNFIFLKMFLLSVNLILFEVVFIKTLIFGVYLSRNIFCLFIIDMKM